MTSPPKIDNVGYFLAVNPSQNRGHQVGKPESQNKVKKNHPLIECNY